MNIVNPVLKGFYPDPSILRVGDDYYLANSTFEWFPGVPIHHSRDLVHWRPIGSALTDLKHLDLKGVPDSSGIWAPSLSYHDGRFYLLYTIVRTRVGPFKDLANYLVTADKIEGPWSDPIFLNGSGFDGSLFHDDDGSKWIVNIEWDHRKGHPRFGGILLQQYDPETKKVVGPIHKILSKPVLIEGPNLYKVNGWYYLMLAEGGTGWNHGISMARSRNITGPYEVDPQSLVVTSRRNPALALQKAGHGELVQTQSGEWYLAHLCSRPIFPERRCMLGRETAIQKVVWDKDGWLRLAHGGTDAAVEVPAPQGLKAHPWPAAPARDDFNEHKLGFNWLSLRVPMDESWCSLKARPGWLRLFGRESQTSLFDQSLVVKRLTSLHTTVETCLELEPDDFMQAAGLICMYDVRTHYYLRVSYDEQLGKVLGIFVGDDGNYDELTQVQISIREWSKCYLRAVLDEEKLQFSASPDGKNWQKIGPILDASKLSDDYGTGLHFTGAMIGLCVQDIRGHRRHADFDYFEVTTKD